MLEIRNTARFRSYRYGTQYWDLNVVCGHNQLAAARMRNSVPFRKGIKGISTLDA
jgi:hypothetical protein